ncbi:hypothetical protein [Leptobacterium sp. I13]|uniref:hypothetical protein n=1 Tax=Leptobacterium meishanense TaxID=3128904 RepID=UPI0030ED4DF7
MLRNVLTYIKEGKHFTGVEWVEHNNERAIYVKSLLFKKNELMPLNAIKVGSLEAFKINFNKSIPVFLVINSNQVITKFMTLSNDTSLNLVNKVFPNINIHDFYYEVSNLGDSTMVSVCRKSYAEDVLNRFESQKIIVAGLSLAFHQIRHVKAYIQSDTIALSTGNLTKTSKQYEFENRMSKEAINYDINGIAVKSECLLSFSAALQLFFKKKVDHSNFDTLNETLQKTFYQKRFLKLFPRVAIGFLLILLLMNFLTFNYYYRGVSRSKLAMEVNNINKKKWEHMNALVTNKEKLANDIINANTSRSAFYIDGITALLPASILLDEINYQPFKKNIKKEEKIVVYKKRIQVSGKSKASAEFSKWVEQLEKQSWVKNVVVAAYGYKNRDVLSFTILITLNDEP